MQTLAALRFSEAANAEEEAAREKLDKRIDAVNASSSTARNSWVFLSRLDGLPGGRDSGRDPQGFAARQPDQADGAWRDCPLSRFFAYAPFAFLIIYIGLLLQLASLADKARALNEEISRIARRQGRQPTPSTSASGQPFHIHDYPSDCRSYCKPRPNVLMQGTCWVTLGLLPVFADSVFPNYLSAIPR